MKFSSDRQRKAMFSRLASLNNSFSNSNINRFSLYFDDFTGDVRSDDIADVALKLNANMPIYQAMKVLNNYPDQDFVGVKKIELIDDKTLKLNNKKPEFITVEKVGDDPRRGPLPKIVAGFRGSIYDSAGKELGTGMGENVFYQSESETSIAPENLAVEYRKQVEKISPWGISNYRELSDDVSDEMAFERTLQRYKHPSFAEARAWRMGKDPKVHIRQIMDFPRRKYERKGEMSIPLEELKEEKEGQRGLKYEDLANMIEMNKIEIVNRLPDEDLIGIKKYIEDNPALYYEPVLARVTSELNNRK